MSTERELYIKHRNVMQNYFCEADPDPLIGWRHIRGISGTFSNKEFNTTVQINSLGFRGPEFNVEPSSQPLTLVLGDSFTVGWGVNEEETFVHLLNKQFPQQRFINLGVSGYSTRSHWGVIRRFGKHFNPEKIILVFYPNDPIEDGLSPLLGPQRTKTASVFPTLYLAELVKKWRKQIGSEFEPPYYLGVNSQFWAITENYLDLIRHWCQNNSVELWVIDLPYKDELLEPKSVGYHPYLKNYCEKYDVYYLDLKPALTQNRTQAYFRLDEHLTPFGHAIVARMVGDKHRLSHNKSTGLSY